MMKKSLFYADRLSFAGMTCLVASILLAIILVVRASYAPAPTTTVTAIPIIPSPHDAIPEPPRPVVVLPPSLNESSIYSIDTEQADDHHRRQGFAFCVQWSPDRRYLVSHASLLSRSDWQQVARINLTSHHNKKIASLELNPLYLGPFTEDHQPNMLTHPDLGLDLVAWSMPGTVKGPGLSLASQNPLQGEDVWIVALQGKNTNAQSHFHCKVLEHSDNALFIQPLDRFPLDQVIGLPVVNQRGEVVGNVLGGNDLSLVGASFKGIKRRLNGIESK